jgi:hypothetical protein
MLKPTADDASIIEAMSITAEVAMVAQLQYRGKRLMQAKMNALD